MKRADNLFDDLGYKRFIDNHLIIYYKKDYLEVRFNLLMKTWEYRSINNKLDVDLVEPINTMIKELGWLNE